jgi:hypothetical protein
VVVHPATINGKTIVKILIFVCIHEPPIRFAQLKYLAAVLISKAVNGNRPDQGCIGNACHQTKKSPKPKAGAFLSYITAAR